MDVVTFRPRVVVVHHPNTLSILAVAIIGIDYSGRDSSRPQSAVVTDDADGGVSSLDLRKYGDRLERQHDRSYTRSCSNSISSILLKTGGRKPGFMQVLSRIEVMEFPNLTPVAVQSLSGQ